MAKTSARPIPPVIEELLRHPQSYSFTQAVRLLCMWAGPQNAQELEAFLNNRLRFRPDLSLAFAVSDIAGLELDFSSDPQAALSQGPLPPFDRARICATFLGLYGPSTPLPKFYTERLLDEQAEDVSVTRDFLDIFNNQIFLLHTLLTSYIQPLRKHLNDYDPRAGKMLMSLASFGEASLCEQLPSQRIFLRYAGFFSQRVRTASGLRAMLADAGGCAATRVRCNVPRLARIPSGQRLRLGQACSTLGEDAVLGDAVACYEGKIVIEFNSLNEKTFRNILPGTPNGDILHALVRNYCRQPVEYSVTARLLPGQACPARLGGEAGRFASLGVDSWLGFGSSEPKAALPQVQAEFMGGFQNYRLTHKAERIPEHTRP